MQQQQHHNGFVYALVEREFTKTNEPVIKVGMSSKSNPADRLRGYPKGSFFIWVRHTPTPRKDERLILATMHIWFKHRRDLGAEYFEGDQNVLTGLLSAMMQARESMRDTESDEDTTTPKEECSLPPVEKLLMTVDRPGGALGDSGKPPAIDNIATFDAFSKAHADRLNRASIPCETLHGMFMEFWQGQHPDSGKPRVGYAWIEKHCKSRLGATIRPRYQADGLTPSCPLIVFPTMLCKEGVPPVPHPLLQKFRCKKNTDRI